MTSKPEANEWSPRGLYDIYRVEIRLRDKLCGGVPKNPELIAEWIKAKTGYDDKETEVQTREALDALIDTETEKSWNGFPADKEKGLFVWARQMKALFKEAATMLRVTVDKRGSKQIFQHGFEIKALNGTDRLYFDKSKPDGFDEGPIHVQTPQGPRTAIKRVDYVEQVGIVFEIWVLGTHAAETRHVSEETIKTMLRFAQENGLGADRSQGRGKFTVVSFECISKAEPRESQKKEESKLKTTAKSKNGASAET
jgi:hypothetical protein